MKTLLVAGLLAVGMIGLPASAFAQAKSSTGAPVYRYCLQETMGMGRDATTMTWCRFDTMAQCWASKNGPADFCYENLAYPRAARK